MDVERLKVCPPVQVLMFPRLSEATTAPVVGEIVRVPSEFETEPIPVTRQVPLMAKHPVLALIPLAKVDVPVPPTLIIPDVWMLPSVVVAMPTPRPPVKYTSPPTFNLARLPYVVVAIPTAPDPPVVVEAVEILKMAKVPVAVDEVAMPKALARSLAKVVEA